MSEIKHLTHKLEKISLESLHYQFIPEFTNMDIWNYDMSLVNSPQVECAELLLKHGRDWSKLKHCRFAEDRRHRYRCGMEKWTEKAIKEHILGSRYDILTSLRKHGFDSKLNKKQPICVLKEPFWATRFGYVADWLKGYEIYHGGRRCSAMYVLGYEKVPVLWAADKHPGSNKGGKYEKKVLKFL
ncbi:MAG: hypothetical protein ACWGNI_00260 [Desulfobacterales bacterium]